MQYLSGALSVLITVIVVNGILAFLRKPVSAEGQTVILPKALLVIGILGSAAFLIPAVVLMLLDGSKALIAVFIALSFLGASLIIAYFNCRITYDESSFVAKNFFGVKRRYTYDEITGICGKTGDVKLYMGKRSVTVDGLAVGKYEFMALAKRQYRKLNRGNPIPCVRAKWDLFNGNVEKPGEFIFAFALIGVIIIGMAVAFTIASVSSDDLEYASLTFADREIAEDELRLFVDGDSMYYGIPAYRELLTETDRFIALCDSGESFSVGYVFYDGEETPFREVHSIAGDDGTVYLSADAVHDYQWKDAWQFYLVFGGLGTVWLATAFATVYVGRHPERFSRRVIRLFFKDGYVCISKDDVYGGRPHP